jgi:outer membrane protein assembly factor BamB
MAAFSEAVLPPYAASDERLLFSVASSIGSLCRFSGPPLSDRGIRLLTALAGGDRPAVVRSRARAEIASVSGK